MKHPIELGAMYQQCQRKDRKPVRIKAKQRLDTYPFRNLPFVAGKRSKVTATAWDIPAGGGYFGGYKTGEAMALAYLKHDRAHGRSHMYYQFREIVESFLIRIEQEGGWAAYCASEGNDEMAGLRGQFVGFMNTISDRLTMASRFLFHDLDMVTERELIDIANLGLNFDHVAYMGSLSDDDAEGGA